MKLARSLFALALVGFAASSVSADQLDRVRVRQAVIDGVTWNYSVNGSSAMLGAPGGSAVPRDTAGRIVVPGEIDGFRVGGFYLPLFRRCENLEEVDFTKLEGRSLRGGFFRDCPALRRVVFPRRPYFVAGSDTGSSFFENCPAIEELVFPGSVPPEFRNLGVSLDGRLRVGREFERAWRVFAEDHDVSGWSFLEETEGGDAATPRQGDSTPPMPDSAIALAYVAREQQFKPLEQLSASMVAAIKKLKAETEKKEEGLRAGMVKALERAKSEAQSRGDLDGMLLFDEAAKNPDATPRSDNETLREIFKTRDQAKAGYRAELDKGCAQILSKAVEQLESMKKKETMAGNTDAALEVQKYQKEVQSVLDRYKRRTGGKNDGPAQGGAAGRSADGGPGSTGKGVGPDQLGGTSRNVVVPVNKGNGANLGRFEKDEILVVQYLSGDYRPYRGSSRTVNPDQESDFYYSSEGSMMLEGPLNSQDKRSYRIPKGTSRRPFALVVPVGGHFNLKCTAGNYSEGRVTYKVTKLSILEAREFQKSVDKNAYQWP